MSKWIHIRHIPYTNAPTRQSLPIAGSSTANFRRLARKRKGRRQQLLSLASSNAKFAAALHNHAAYIKHRQHSLAPARCVMLGHTQLAGQSLRDPRHHKEDRGSTLSRCPLLYVCKLGMVGIFSTMPT